MCETKLIREKSLQQQYYNKKRARTVQSDRSKSLQKHYDILLATIMQNGFAPCFKNPKNALARQ